MKKSGFVISFSFWFVVICGLFSLSSPVARAQISECPSDLTSYWKFDEPGGTLFLDSVGTSNIGCTGSGCPSSVAGRIGNALAFDGIDDGLSVPSDASFNWGSADSFSIELWMKTDSAGSCPGGQVFIGRRDGTNELIWWLGCRQGGTPAFAVGDKAGSYISVTGTSLVTDGAWHHVVGRRDAGTNEISLYVDGQKQAVTIQDFTGGFDSAVDLNIGWLNMPGGFHFQGQLDEVALYKQVLGAADIVRHYYQGSAGLQGGYCGCSSPVRIMPLGDSITMGVIPPTIGSWNDYTGGYRQKLYIDLTTGGHTVDFVGSQQTGALAVPPFDSDHEGYPGYYAAGSTPPGDIASQVYNWLVANPADVVLLHIGTCDVNLGTQSAASVSAILDNIYAYNPDITVVLARIIKEQGYETQVTQYNHDVEAMALNRIATRGDKIVIVDQENALNYVDDMTDGIHPNQLGYNKMADVWLNGLKSFLPVCVNNVPSTYTIVSTAGTGGSIMPSGAVTVNNGSDQTFTITPHIGYSIADVKVDGTSSGVISTYTFNDVTANHTIETTFRLVFPDINVNPASLDFNKVKTRVTATKSITVRNAGEGKMTVSKLVISGKDRASFSATLSAARTVNPSESFELNVIFKPASTGRKNAVLLITSDDPDTPVLSIPLTGIGSPK